MVLAHALKSCPGAAVVGVVGKGHVPGIRRLWAQDTAALLPATGVSKYVVKTVFDGPGCGKGLARAVDFQWWGTNSVDALPTECISMYGQNDTQP